MRVGRDGLVKITYRLSTNDRFKQSKSHYEYQPVELGYQHKW